MKRAMIGGVIGLGLAVILSAPANAQNAGLNRCTRVTEVTSETSVEISSRPAIVCSVHLIATASNARGVVFDSPSNTDQQSSQHGQFRVISEPGSATVNNSVAHPFGDNGVLTHFGLGGYVINGRMIVHWDN